MPSNPIVVVYINDVPAADGRRAFLAGERYEVPSTDAAEAVHPDAVYEATNKPVTTKKTPTGITVKTSNKPKD